MWQKSVNTVETRENAMRTFWKRALAPILILALLTMLAACGTVANVTTAPTGGLKPDWTFADKPSENPFPVPSGSGFPEPSTGGNEQPSQGIDYGIGGSMQVSFYPDATAYLSEKRVSMYYANSTASHQDVIVFLMVGDTVIAQSESVMPGQELRELALEDDAIAFLREESYDAELLIYYYDHESGDKTLINAKCELTLEVIA